MFGRIPEVSYWDIVASKLSCGKKVEAFSHFFLLFMSNGKRCFRCGIPSFSMWYLIFFCWNTNEKGQHVWRHSEILKHFSDLPPRWFVLLLSIWWDYPKSSFTLALMARPSANPASFLVAVPITLPMSFGPSAPTSAMIAFKAVSNSSAFICFGR